VSERATFHFRRTKTYEQQVLGVWETVTSPPLVLDQDGNPLDKTVRVRQVLSKQPVRIPVAVEFSTSSLDERPIGAFKATKATLTILDTHWPQVQDAIEVELGGDHYVISYAHPPMGLFEVTVHMIECFARSET
jgi:hypothetical protein